MVREQLHAAGDVRFPDVPRMLASVVEQPREATRRNGCAVKDRCCWHVTKRRPFRQIRCRKPATHQMGKFKYCAPHVVAAKKMIPKLKSVSVERLP